MQNLWYAVVAEEGDGWDNGYTSREEAIAAAKKIPGAWVEVIEDDQDFYWWSECIEKIEVWEDVKNA